MAAKEDVDKALARIRDRIHAESRSDDKGRALRAAGLKPKLEEIETTHRNSGGSSDATLAEIKSLESALGPSSVGFWRGLLGLAANPAGWMARFAVLAIVVGMVIVIGQLMLKMGVQAWQTIEGGRAILLVALTAAFVTFGGALTLSPLFDDSANGELAEQRYRRAREVFLLFAGMFSTVVGFYFASATAAGSPIVATHEWNAQRGELRVSVAGGKPPYTVDVEVGTDAKPKGIQRLASIGTAPPFSFTPGKEWPVPLTIVVIDSASSTARLTFSPNEKELQAAGFKPPTGKTPSSDPPTAQPATSGAPDKR